MYVPSVIIIILLLHIRRMDGSSQLFPIKVPLINTLSLPLFQCTHTQ